MAVNTIEELIEFEPYMSCYEYGLNKLDLIITEQIDQSDNQVECQTLRWVLDKISELL